MTKTASRETFEFKISLEVLNLLGRGLYGSFTTILGEAISNAWDADAEKVWIYINEENSTLLVKDDGIGMNEDDFQNKFLKVGYSKRVEGGRYQGESPKGRSYIGRKGIGKLALLSCARIVSVYSQKDGFPATGGAIDNVKLDEAIAQDKLSGEYKLNEMREQEFNEYTGDYEHGTIILFKQLEAKIISNIKRLKKMIALSFRFSLKDPDFAIYVNDEEVSVNDLEELVNSTQFLWTINQLDDPFIERLRETVCQQDTITDSFEVRGFIASVKKPTNLTIYGADEKVGVDLFVNGRLREKAFLRHRSKARVPESYLYGQIHFDQIDAEDKDRFKTDREGIIGDELSDRLLDKLAEIQTEIVKQWDDWRRNLNEDGDPDNNTITKVQRKAAELINSAVKDFTQDLQKKERGKANQWINDWRYEAQFNVESYVKCFLAENLLRRYIFFIKKADLEGHERSKEKAEDKRKSEKNKKSKVNLTIPIRKETHDLYYLGMEDLSRIAEETSSGNPDKLSNDEKIYTLLRNAVMHTSPLTKEAKESLKAVYNNIEGKIRGFLEKGKN